MVWRRRFAQVKWIGPDLDTPSTLAYFPESVSSCTGFIDQCFPDAFRFENQFNGFTNRAVAGERLRRIVGNFPYLRDSVSHCNREAGPAHERDIGKIIANVGNGGLGDPCLLEDLFKSRHL